MYDMRLLANILNRSRNPRDDAASKPSEGRGAKRRASQDTTLSPSFPRKREPTPSPSFSRRRESSRRDSAIPLERFRDDPIAFVAHALPNAGTPYPKQVEMLNLAANERKISIVGCNGSGKDWTLARIILWWIETRPQAKVVVIAPTQRQIEHILWPEMASAVAQASVPLSGKLTQSRYTVAPDRFAIAFSTNKPENILGFHSPELMLIVDEAHAVEESHFDAARRLNAKKTILAGNAFSTSGEFYDSHHGKSDHYKTPPHRRRRHAQPH